MKEFYLFEAGSTKTKLAISKAERIEIINLPGFNPNRINNEFKTSLAHAFKPIANSSVYFYGSGLGNLGNKNIVREMFSKWDLSHLEVNDDIVGAARALLRREPGILGIMGTGGLGAYYNGESVIERRGGYGYLIDDLGGGYELGKRITTAWLNNDLNKEVDELVQDHFNLCKEDFTGRYYKEKSLEVIASLAERISSYGNEPSVNLILCEYFHEFVKKDLKPLCAKHNFDTISLIGSLAHGYQNLISKELENQKLKCTKLLQYPIDELVNFHRGF